MANYKKRENKTGSITKMSGKRRKPYRARVTIGWEAETGKQIFGTIGYFSKRSEAEAALTEYIKSPYDTTSNEVTFGDVYNMWSAKRYKEIAASTIRSYKSAFSHSKPLWDMRMQDIRVNHLETTIQNANVGSSTKFRMKVMFNLLFKFAIKHEIVIKDYSKYCDSVKVEKPSKEKKPFSAEEIALLWENIEIPFVDMILIAIYSGWRPIELVMLEKENIDLTDNFMKGGCKIEAGKNRLVPIHPKIKPLIEKRYFSNNNSHLLFTIDNCDSEKGMSYTQYYNRFKNLTCALGMDHSPHETRHTFATLAKEAKVDEYCLKLILGHNIADLTERVYTHRKKEQLLEEIKKIK